MAYSVGMTLGMDKRYSAFALELGLAQHRAEHFLTMNASRQDLDEVDLFL